MDGAPIEAFSNALSSMVTGLAPTMVAVHARKRMPASGFLWKPGLVVTAEEAVTRDEDLAVTLPDGRKIAATLAGRDASTDIALLRIDDTTAPRMPATASAAVGALVLAVGRDDNGPVAQSGIIASVGPAWRSMRGGHIDQLIRLDFRANPSIEGGVVLAANGGVLGMLAVGPRGHGLVIPLSTVTRAASVLEQHGHVARGYLGLGLQPVKLEDAVMANHGLTERRALMVVSVDGNGPGKAAGILQGDIIVRWNGDPVTDVRALMRRLGPETVGQAASFDMVRGGVLTTHTVTIAARPAS